MFSFLRGTAIEVMLLHCSTASKEQGSLLSLLSSEKPFLSAPDLKSDDQSAYPPDTSVCLLIRLTYKSFIYETFLFLPL